MFYRSSRLFFILSSKVWPTPVPNSACGEWSNWDIFPINFGNTVHILSVQFSKRLLSSYCQLAIASSASRDLNIVLEEKKKISPSKQEVQRKTSQNWYNDSIIPSISQLPTIFPVHCSQHVAFVFMPVISWSKIATIPVSRANCSLEV